MGLSYAKAGSQNKSLPGKLQSVIPATKTTEGIYQHTPKSYKGSVGSYRKPEELDNDYERIAVVAIHAGRIATL